ncbi:hypothetical protein CEUSTIGMA_g1436.t1 [Chlamydomonas eustigma]|uniref:SET domain-containing protein n=1 Tax=Chlamydomonas eustigma TaxID=1157962 RepID=A0A250WTB1_9CHLO|nr:hypothetical protein CEUSTIGMA_g1436.t1 [Chlamydomonas eustigma]|eukprot:GAX73986.1 hypothetical protein CEUSTIGMA_g1436.t1 [Chlamydomonas eustigma]
MQKLETRYCTLRSWIYRKVTCMRGSRVNSKTHAGQQRSAKDLLRKAVRRNVLSRTTPVEHELDMEALYRRMSYETKADICYAQPARIPGKGVGLVATKDFNPGDLILISRPLGIIYGQLEHPPSNEELVTSIMNQPRDTIANTWLQLLRDRAHGSRVEVDDQTLHSCKLLLQCTASQVETDDDSSMREPDTSSKEVDDQTLHSCKLLLQCTASQVETDDDSSMREPDTSSKAFIESTEPLKLSQVIEEHSFGEVRERDSAPGIISSIVSPGLQGSHLKESARAGAGAGAKHDKSFYLQAVTSNSYSETSEDAALAELRDVEPLSFTGLWPGLALINHACSPNTAPLVVGGNLLLHASRTIFEGDEITVCYLGKSRFMDVTYRRAFLSAGYGFHCCCKRCVIEHLVFPTQRLPPEVEEADNRLASSLLASTSPDSPAAQSSNPVLKLTHSLLTALIGPSRYRVGAARNNRLLLETNRYVENSLALDARDASTALRDQELKLEAVVQQLKQAEQAVQGELEYLQFGDHDRKMLLASVAGLFSLHHEVIPILGDRVQPEEEAAVLRQWWEAVDAVGRGSETHMFLSLLYQAKLRRAYGADSVEAKAAALKSAAAHTARYGKVSSSLLKELMAVRMKLATGSLMALRISALAWDLDTKRTNSDDLDAPA